jgi:hypothetical protein
VTRQAGRTWPIVLAVAVAAFAFPAVSATAHETSSQTDIVDDAFIFNGEEIFVTGHLTSPKEGCLANRTVRLFAMDDAGTPSDPSDDVRTSMDTDRTSRNGGFYLKGVFPEEADYVYVRVARKNIGPPGHKHICEPQSADPS